MIELETFTLRSGGRYVRPAGSLGTCGFYPRAWQIVRIERRETPLAAFLRGNPNWRGEQ